MARAEDTQVVERFEQFYRDYYRNEIGELAQKYPNEQRSLYIDWADLYRFDPDLADDFIAQPNQILSYAEKALQLYDLPVDVTLGRAHVRIVNLQEATDIRDIRARHRGRLIAVTGIIRKATGVRPKITEAAFECQRCGTLTPIPQTSGEFHEPHECQGCERQGPFEINFDQSEFVDAQKLRVQESPEGLRGGETPESIDVHIEDDITGEVTAGDHVRVTGILHLDQQGSQQDKSPIFDVYMEGLAVEIEDEQFEEMDITDEDKQHIIELSDNDDIYDKMVDSMAPSIYGYEQEKLAMILQLFSGVTKHLPDGSRIRGDLHMLLIGDPGTGKCQKRDAKVALADGTQKEIGDLVETHLDDPVPIDDGVYQDVDIPVLTTDGRTIEPGRATKIWKRTSPDQMYRIHTANGRTLEVTPSHPLFEQQNGTLNPIRASNLAEDDFIAAPRALPTQSSKALTTESSPPRPEPSDTVTSPDRLSKDVAQLLGYTLSGGHISEKQGRRQLTIPHADIESIQNISSILDTLGAPYRITNQQSEDRSCVITCSSEDLIQVLEDLEPSLRKESTDYTLPQSLFCASQTCKSAFLNAYIDGNETITATESELTTPGPNRRLLEEIQTLLLSFKIQSQIHSQHSQRYHLTVSGKDFDRFQDKFGLTPTHAITSTATRQQVSPDPTCDVIPNVSDALARIRTALNLSEAACGIDQSTYHHYEQGDKHPPRGTLRRILRVFQRRTKQLRELRSGVVDGDWHATIEACNELDISPTPALDTRPIDQPADSASGRDFITPDGGRRVDEIQRVVRRLDTALSTDSDIRQLSRLTESDIRWLRIESITSVTPEYDWVYDLEVDGTHSYISNNVISHNSQMLQYVRNLAPRSVYTSGKGSSSAGLTAAAVRDDFADGQQWTLEAGALVLADQGIAAVDELDKMDSSDRSALHEGLEQQKISVSKAGINATLKARCSLLGAANPKYGRFNPYEPIGEQIELEPALISRFDLIFTVTDQPDAEEDANLAEHIINTNYAGELHTHRKETTTSNVTQQEVENVTDDVQPVIEPELLRKYIAYAKRNCFPTMTDDAKQAIRDFYVDLRAQGQDEDAPVPVTARKLEGLVRLSEASARMRLSDTVEKEDADRVIAIVRSSLKNIGIDPETGQLDADVVETGKSKSQRERIKSIKALIDEIEDEYDEGAPIDEVLDRAEEIGVERSKAEHELEKLRRQGDVYEPQPDHLRTV